MSPRRILNVQDPFRASDALFSATIASRLALYEDPDVAWITPEPRMPKLLVRYQPNWVISLALESSPRLGGEDLSDKGQNTGYAEFQGAPIDADAFILNPGNYAKSSVLSGRAVIRYKDKFRDDRFGASVLSSNASLTSWNEQTFELGKTIRGGDMHVVGLHSIASIWLPAMADLFFTVVNKKIRGCNPCKEAIRSYIKSQVGDPDDARAIQVIAWDESKFHQFYPATEGRELHGLPMQPKREPGAYGIMQLRWWEQGKLQQKVRPSPEQLWDWKANVRQGIAIYVYYKAKIHEHYDRILAANPAAKAQFAAQFANPSLQFYRFAYHQRYLGGYYWLWNSDKRRWVVDPERHAHGDFMVKIEDLVRAGKTSSISEWNERPGERQSPCPGC